MKISSITRFVYSFDDFVLKIGNKYIKKFVHRAVKPHFFQAAFLCDLKNNKSVKAT